MIGSNFKNELELKIQHTARIINFEHFYHLLRKNYNKMGNTNERGAGTRELLAEARRVTEGKFNIMVVKAGHEYDITGISQYLYQAGR